MDLIPPSPLAFLHRRPSGFSQIEILVVVLIIAVLAVLTYPALNAVMTAKEKPRSISRLKALTMGSIAYSADNNGKIPTWGYVSGSRIEPRWQTCLVPDYVPYPPGVTYWRDCDFLGCEVQKKMASTTNMSTFHLNGNVGYYVGTNSLGVDYGTTFARTVQELEAPSKTALFMHAVWNGLSGDSAVFSKTDATRYGDRVQPVFGKSVLISFCDGSVQSRNPRNTNDVPQGASLSTPDGKLFWYGKR